MTLKSCAAINNKGHSFRKGVPFKWLKPKPVCGISVVKREIAAVFHCGDFHFGGPNRDRTDDLTDANRTLSQLSYRPIYCFSRRKPAYDIIAGFFKK